MIDNLAEAVKQLELAAFWFFLAECFRTVAIVVATFGAAMLIMRLYADRPYPPSSAIDWRRHMKQFANKEEMTAAYAADNPRLHNQFINDSAKYVPHLYRGGYVIRGFGYSVERIGRFVAASEAGDPRLV